MHKFLRRFISVVLVYCLTTPVSADIPSLGIIPHPSSAVALQVFNQSALMLSATTSNCAHGQAAWILRQTVGIFHLTRRDIWKIFAAAFTGNLLLAQQKTISRLVLPFPETHESSDGLPPALKEAIEKLKTDLSKHRQKWLVPDASGILPAEHDVGYAADANALVNWIQVTFYPIVMKDMLSHRWITIEQAVDFDKRVKDLDQRRIFLMDYLFPHYFGHYGLFFAANLVPYKRLFIPNYELRSIGTLENHQITVPARKAVVSMQAYWMEPSEIQTVYEFNPNFGALRIIQARPTNKMFIRSDLFKTAVNQQASKIDQWMRNETLAPTDFFESSFRRLTINAVVRSIPGLGLMQIPSLEQTTDAVRQLEIARNLKHEAAHMDSQIQSRKPFIPLEDIVFVEETQADLAESIGGEATITLYSLGDMMQKSLTYSQEFGPTERDSDLIHIRNRIAFWFLHDHAMQQSMNIQLPSISESIKKFSDIDPSIQIAVWEHVPALSDDDLQKLYQKVWDEFMEQSRHWSPDFKDIGNGNQLVGKARSIPRPSRVAPKTPSPAKRPAASTSTTERLVSATSLAGSLDFSISKAIFPRSIK